MSTFKPYTYFQCPCSDTSIPANSSTPQILQPTKKNERLIQELHARTIAYIRWNIFYTARIVTKFDARDVCTRSCFQCPICISPLSVNEAPIPEIPNVSSSPPAPYILHCAYCMWSSTEIGIRFEKPNSVYSQLSKIKNGGDPLISAKERRRDRDERRTSLATETILEEADEVIEKHVDPNEKLDIESQYANLKSFYQSQLADSNPSSALGFSNDYGYGSPEH
ncbi:dynactin arp1 p62 subunit ro2 [Botrytis cinerea]